MNDDPRQLAADVWDWVQMGESIDAAYQNCCGVYSPAAQACYLLNMADQIRLEGLNPAYVDGPMAEWVLYRLMGRLPLEKKKPA